MKHLLFIFFSVGTITLFGQNIEVFGGLNQNQFRNKNENLGNNQNNYSSDIGYSFGIGIDSVKADWMLWRVTLQYLKYDGKINASSGGLGAQFSSKVTMNKSLLSFGIHPFNYQLIKNLEWSLGMEFSFLASESFEGSYSSIQMGSTNYDINKSGDVNDVYSEYNSKFYFGLRTRLKYNFSLNEALLISPQYSFYYGVSNEFSQQPTGTKSMRHFVGLGLSKKLNRSK